MARFNGASAAPRVLVAWSFLYILLGLGSCRFDKPARICALLFPSTDHTVTDDKVSVSSGNTPLAKKGQLWT